MNLKQQCYFLYGIDSYRVFRARKAIEAKFLRQNDSLSDLIVYDMSETSIDTLRQAVMTIPFLVSHRLFVIKNVFQSSKSVQEALPAILKNLAESTIIVIFEPSQPDKRLALFKWLCQHARCEEFSQQSEVESTILLQAITRELNVAFDPAAQRALIQMCAADTWRLTLEAKKLACYVASRGDNIIRLRDVEELCHATSETTAFVLTDALRDGNLPLVIKTYRMMMEKEDPMFVVGAVGSQLRTWAKIFICLKASGRTAPVALLTGLNPYVVKLNQRFAEQLHPHQLKQGYETLVRFDREVKDGMVDPTLGLSLALVKLSRTFCR